MLQKIYDWVVYSSKNPEKISTTIKGIAVFVPSAVIFLNLVNLNVAPETLTDLIYQIAGIASAAAVLISGLVSAYAAFRKVFKTTAGTNELLNKYY